MSLSAGPECPERWDTVTADSCAKPPHLKLRRPWPQQTPQKVRWLSHTLLEAKQEGWGKCCLLGIWNVGQTPKGGKITGFREQSDQLVFMCCHPPEDSRTAERPVMQSNSPPSKCIHCAPGGVVGRGGPRTPSRPR